MVRLLPRSIFRWRGVHIIGRAEDPPPTGAPHVQVSLIREPMQGDYVLHVSVFPRMESPPGDERDVVRQIAAAVGAVCLVSDESPSAYTWLRVASDGQVERVFPYESGTQQ